MQTNSTIKQHLYHWQAIDKNHQQLQGYSISPNRLLLQHSLTSKGYFQPKFKRIILFSDIKKIACTDIQKFFNELSSLLNANISLVDSLALLLQTPRKPSLYLFIDYLHQQTQMGKSLCYAIALYNAQLPNLVPQLLKAGELSGQLAQTCQLIANYLLDKMVFKKKLINTLIYPSILIITALAAMLLVSTVMIPSFQSLFHSMNGEIPYFTQLTIKVSRYITKTIFILPTILLAILIYWKIAIRYSVRYVKYTELLLLKMPVVGDSKLIAELQRYNTSMSITLGAAVPLIDSLELAANSIQLIVLKETMLTIRDEVVKGKSLSRAMQNISYIPAQMQHMISLGEQTGELDIAYHNLAILFASKLTERMARIKQLIEFFILTLLGVIIGFVVIAMYLPILNMGLLI